MLNKSISVLTATGMVALLATSLSGCGGGGSSSTPPAPSTAAYYVNPTTGSDTTGDGSSAKPWQTLTYALNATSAVAAASGANIHAASGLYSTASSEVFPIMPTSGEHIIGAGSAVISGSANFAAAGGDLGAGSLYPTAVVFQSGVSSASMSNMTVNNLIGGEDVFIDNATVTLTNNTFSAANVALVPFDGAKLTLNGNTIAQAFPACVLVADASTHLTARNNTIANCGGTGIYAGYFSPIPGTAVDLGTAASHGNNTILGDPTGEGLAQMNVSGGTIQAVGNTWLAGVQFADPSGHYASQVIPVGTAFAGGNNYDTTAAAIQF